MRSYKKRLSDATLQNLSSPFRQLRLSVRKRDFARSFNAAQNACVSRISSQNSALISARYKDVFRQKNNLPNCAKNRPKLFEVSAVCVIMIAEDFMDKQKLEFLNAKSDEIRKILIEMIGRLGVGHVGGSLSVVDLLTGLY